MPYRTLATGQTARVHVHDVGTRSDIVVFATGDMLLEAPNWSPDGTCLLLNGNGRLWSLALRGGPPVEIPLSGILDLNNDHVPSPDGEAMFLSAEDGQLYRAPLGGGRALQITADDGIRHYLHGVSPDGRRLAYVRIAAAGEPGALVVMPSGGGPGQVVDTGPGHIDGPEWSPDGEWIHLNSERWATRPGHAQLARIRDDGRDMERLVESDTVDWFPHLSPDGRLAVYLEFPPGTQGHPADLDVTLVVVGTGDWATPLLRIPLRGGQGTINVNSWSPDSTRFAYVSYPGAP